MASTTHPSLPSVNLDNSLGALLVGGLISTALLGLTSLQTYFYFVNYPKDKPAFKWLVGVLWLLDFGHSMLVSHSLYHFLVKESGNTVALLRGEWSIIAETGVTIAVTIVVQSFMAVRVYRLSNHNWLLTGIIAILTLGHAGLGTLCVVKLVQIHYFYKLPSIMGIMSATLVLMATNDVIITASLCWFLRKAQSSFDQTNSMIRMLILYTIETGLLTSVFVTIDAICILTMPRNWIFIGITFCVSKLYANSLLTILNSRRSLQNRKDIISQKITTSFKATQNRESRYVSTFPMQDITIHTEKDVHVDVVSPKVEFVGSVTNTNELGFAV